MADEPPQRGAYSFDDPELRLVSIRRLRLMVLATGATMAIGGIVAGAPAFALVAVGVVLWANYVLLLSRLVATGRLSRRGGLLGRMAVPAVILAIVLVASLF